MSSRPSLHLRRTVVTLAAALAATVVAAPAASAQGRLVVNADEWTLSNPFISSGTRDGDEFAVNARNWLTGNVPGNLLAFSNNFGLTGSALATQMATGGYTWTVVDPTGAGAAAAWAARNTYRAIFLGGNAVPDLTQLVDYVNGGGSVYLMGGTGLSLPGGEAAYWDAFLARFGFEFGPSYNSIGGDIATTAFGAQGPFGAAVFGGVDVLYQDNGNDVLNTVALPGDVTRQTFVARQSNLFGAAAITAVPEPSTYVLLGSGLLALGAIARRRRTG